MIYEEEHCNVDNNGAQREPDFRFCFIQDLLVHEMDSKNWPTLAPQQSLVDCAQVSVQLPLPLDFRLFSISILSDGSRCTTS